MTTTAWNHNIEISLKDQYVRADRMSAQRCLIQRFRPIRCGDQILGNVHCYLIYTVNTAPFHSHTANNVYLFLVFIFMTYDIYLGRILIVLESAGEKAVSAFTSGYPDLGNGWLTKQYCSDSCPKRQCRGKRHRNTNLMRSNSRISHICGEQSNYKVFHNIGAK